MIKRHIRLQGARAYARVIDFKALNKSLFRL